MQNKRFFILRFYCREEGMLFKKDPDRLAFCQIYEKRLRPFLTTYAWGFTDELALFLVSSADNHDQAMKKADVVLRKYTRYYRRRYREMLKLGKKVIHLPQPDRQQLTETVTRIQCLPLIQGRGSNFVEYPWTSYLLLMGDEKYTWLEAPEVMEWFGGKEAFREAHHRFVNKNLGEKESDGGKFCTFILNN